MNRGAPNWLQRRRDAAARDKGEADGLTASRMNWIAIGISVQIFIGSLITGLQKSLVDTTIGNAAQISVVSDADDRLIEKYEPIAAAALRRLFCGYIPSPVRSHPCAALPAPPCR